MRYRDDYGFDGAAMSERNSNEQLRRAVADSGSTYQALALRINRLGAERGLRLTYGRAAISQWIAGHQPPADVRDLVAEVLTQRLGSQVTASALWPDSLASKGLLFLDPVDQSIGLLADLTATDLTQPGPLTGIAYQPQAMITAVWRWLLGPAEPEAQRTDERASVQVTDLDAVHTALTDLDQRDHHDGGLAIRPEAVRLLHRDVVPLLRRPAPPALRRDLLALAALATRRAAMACYDAGEQGLAQHYFVQGLRLAHGAGHRALGAHILVSMAHQAIDLDHPGLAGELATAAAAGAGNTAPATLTAKIALMQARASARRGTAAECRDHLDDARRLFDTADPAQEPHWTGNISQPYVDGQIATCQLDLGALPDAFHHAHAAIDQHDAHQRRRQATSRLLLARVLAAQGDTTAASHAGQIACGLVADLASHRAHRDLTLLTTDLKPARHHDDVHAFLDQARTLLTTVA